MKSGDRQLQILEAMKKNNSISVNELLEMLPASPATIRRDITALEQAGKIRKARGRIFLEDIRRAPSYEMRDASASAKPLLRWYVRTTLSLSTPEPPRWRWLRTCGTASTSLSLRTLFPWHIHLMPLMSMYLCVAECWRIWR